MDLLYLEAHAVSSREVRGQLAFHRAVPVAVQVPYHKGNSVDPLFQVYAGRDVLEGAFDVVDIKRFVIAIIPVDIDVELYDGIGPYERMRVAPGYAEGVEAFYTGIKLYSERLACRLVLRGFGGNKVVAVKAPAGGHRCKD